MQHPDPNRRKEPCKNQCAACKACKDRETIQELANKPQQPSAEK